MTRHSANVQDAMQEAVSWILRDNRTVTVGYCSQEAAVTVRSTGPDLDAAERRLREALPNTVIRRRGDVIHVHFGLKEEEAG